MSTLIVKNLDAPTGESIVAPDLTLPSGSVIRVLQGINSTTFSTQGVNFTDITDLEVTLTPTNVNSKFLLEMNLYVCEPSFIGLARFTRNGSVIGVNTNPQSRKAASGVVCAYVSNSDQQYHLLNVSSKFLDDPDTTDAITYKVQLCSHSSNIVAYINRSEQDRPQGNYDARTISTLTVTEIAG